MKNSEGVLGQENRTQRSREARVGSSAKSSVASVIDTPSTLHERTESEEVLRVTLQLGKGAPRGPKTKMPPLEGRGGGRGGSSGPSPRGTAGYQRLPSPPLLRQGPHIYAPRAQARPAVSHDQVQRASRGPEAAAETPSPECVETGVTGAGAGRLRPQRGGALRRDHVGGPRLPGLGVATPLPAARRAPRRPRSPPLAAGQSHSPHLARLLCLLRGRHLSET